MYTSSFKNGVLGESELKSLTEGISLTSLLYAASNSSLFFVLPEYPIERSAAWKTSLKSF